jgi:hypothetical protein
LHFASCSTPRLAALPSVASAGTVPPLLQAPGLTPCAGHPLLAAIRVACCCREGEIGRKRDLSAQAACKRLDILYATRLARADKLSARFLLTQTGPPLYYCPAKPSQETVQLAEAQRQVHQLWKAGEMERLEREKAELMARLTQPPRQRGQQQQLQQHGEAEQQQHEGEGEDAAMVGAEAGEEEEAGSDEDMQAEPAANLEQQQEHPAKEAQQQQQPPEPQAPAPEAQQPQQGTEESAGDGNAAQPMDGAADGA